MLTQSRSHSNVTVMGPNFTDTGGEYC